MEKLYRECIEVLGYFDYDTANRISNKIIKVIPTTGNIFNRLMTCEKTYTSMDFLRPKMFRKEDFLSTNYIQLGEDLAKDIQVVEQDSERVAAGNSLFIEHQSLSQLLKAVEKIVAIRRDLVQIYRTISQTPLGSPLPSVFEEITIVTAAYESSDFAITLGVFGIGIGKELLILKSLMEAQRAITSYQYKDAMVLLYIAKKEISDWKKLIQDPEYLERASSIKNEDFSSSWRATLFGSSSEKSYRQSKRGDTIPRTMQWHSKAIANLTSKSTLYFMATLLDKEKKSGGDEKSLWSKVGIDYHEQIKGFVKRSGAVSLSLMYEVSKGVPFSPSGFLPTRTRASYQHPMGLQSFPFIYSYPEAPVMHLPSIVSILQGTVTKFSDPRAGPFYLYDHKIGNTFYLTKIDSNVTMVVIYPGHNSKDALGVEFIEQLSNVLRGTNVTKEMVE